MRQTRRIAALAALAALLATVAGGGGCQDRAASAAPQQVEEAAPPPTEERPADGGGSRVLVRAMTLEPETFVESIEVTGTLAPWDDVVVSSELGGLVREVAFDKGDRVREGQLLARIGDDLAEARLQQAKARLTAAESNFEQAERLFERQAVPRQRLIEATAELHRSRAAVREQELLLDRSLIRAPIAGVAVSREIEPGEVVPPATFVTTLQRIDRLEVVGSVPDTEIGWLAVGRGGTITVDAYPGRIFEGTLSYVAAVADPGTRAFRIELALDNRDRALRPGLVARMRLVKRRLNDAVVAPLDALLTRTDGTVAFVVETCAARERRVEIGAFEDDRVLVESGLAAGDRLVVDGQSNLTDGQRVTMDGCP